MSVHDMYDDGYKAKFISSYLNLDYAAVKSIILLRQQQRDSIEDRPYYRNQPKVAAIRHAARMLASGVSLRQVASGTGIDRDFLLKLLADPRIVEAMYEFDPRVTYDYNSLEDRATVGHQLCTETFDLSERAGIVAAIIFPKERHEEVAETTVGCGSPQRQIRPGTQDTGRRARPHHGRRP